MAVAVKVSQVVKSANYPILSGNRLFTYTQVRGYSTRASKPNLTTYQNGDRIMTRLVKALLFITQNMLILALYSGLTANPVAAGDSSPFPNILFIVLDDVGIDKMQVFGYGGLEPPQLPSIETIAHAGVLFKNTWAMPECSPSRAVFFLGRYPFRTNILGAIGPLDLANSQVSPFETTIPLLLKKRNYKSGLFGKFHIGGPENNLFGNASPQALGWDFFYGFMGADPASIDSTAGGVAAPETYSCGFVNDAMSGACYFADGVTCDDTLSGIAPGRTCMEEGGLFVPNQVCQSTPPAELNFDTLNAYFVSPLVINHENGLLEEVPPTDPRARMYRTTATVNAARDWINSMRNRNKRWMATVSFSSAHTPYQQPPLDLLSPDSIEGSDLDCKLLADQRVISNQMIESMDTEIGRLLVETGLATRLPSGHLDYLPETTNTMIIVLGDNGSFAFDTKFPFDFTRSKGTSYQTGVWVPLIIAGPLVNTPDRIVSSMVNVADLFELFAEIAGIDAHKKVRIMIDSVSMLPYLTDPSQASIRTSNFAQSGVNIGADGVRNSPCTITIAIGTACTQIPLNKLVCEDNGGIWWGVGADDPLTDGIPAEGLELCCDVNRFRFDQGESLYAILPDASTAIRNTNFKLVMNSTRIFNPATVACVDTTSTEFYEINEDVPIPRLDTAANELLQVGLTSEQQANFDALSAELEALLATQVDCPGDGNLDFVVNQKDIKNWKMFSSQWGLSSVYDFNFDGLTDSADRTIIEENLGTKCLK